MKQTRAEINNGLEAKAQEREPAAETFSLLGISGMNIATLGIYGRRVARMLDVTPSTQSENGSIRLPKVQVQS